MRPDTLGKSVNQLHPVKWLNPVLREKFRGEGQLFSGQAASNRRPFFAGRKSPLRATCTVCQAKAGITCLCFRGTAVESCDHSARGDLPCVSRESLQQ